MCFRPVSASASMRRTLSATGIIFFSDWKPSRGPSSEITTRLGKSDMTGLLVRSGLFFRECFLTSLAQVRQRHQDQEDRRCDQQAKADRPLQEDHRVAAREQHGATEIFL